MRRVLRDVGFARVRIHVPDDRGIRGTLAIARATGESRLRAVGGRIARALRFGRWAVGAGMVAYAWNAA